MFPLIAKGFIEALRSGLRIFEGLGLADRGPGFEPSSAMEGIGTPSKDPTWRFHG